MSFYIEELPTELNGITMEEADNLADEFLKDEPCNRMWDAMRALRDFYETVISEAVEVKNTADTPQTDYLVKTSQKSRDSHEIDCETCRDKDAYDEWEGNCDECENGSMYTPQTERIK